MSVSSVIDLPTFEALKESMGADFINELVQAYFEEAPQLLDSLQHALAGQDYELFRQAAHSIKSTSNSFGALALGTLAKELEMMGRAADLQGAPVKVEQLVRDYADVKMRLEELCHD
ncbi:MAG TPA: Hpt domain-containing protein [Anaerolineales bacterium]|nr:Hpt domain-containing protein [Anaerolineales bacterium]